MPKVFVGRLRSECLCRVGSDVGSCGVGHADGLFYEMELLERAGMVSLDILNAATAGNATHLLAQDSFGRPRRRPKKSLHSDRTQSP